jgi:hypothetical protein
VKQMRTADKQRFPILSNMDDIPIPTSRDIQRIYIHESWSWFGDAEEIDIWHRNRPKPFKEIGYNAVVNAGENEARPDVGFPSGLIQLGRGVNKIPAHVLGDNSRSLGICLVGFFDKKDKNGKPGDIPDSAGPREKAMGLLVATYCKRLDLPVRQVLGHREAKFIPGVPDPHKTCPGENVDCDHMRTFILDIINNRYNELHEWYIGLVSQFRDKHPDYAFTNN